jgi:opacity protein-like surface antigen
MKKLLTIAVMACLLAPAQARRVKTTATLQASCGPCEGEDFIVLTGDGYQAGETVRVDWSDESGPLWNFDCAAGVDGTFSESWLGVPAGSYTVVASQPRNRVKWDVVATVEVHVQ